MLNVISSIIVGCVIGDAMKPAIKDLSAKLNNMINSNER